MSLKSEVLALVFGMLLILVTFGDAHLTSHVGNLDVIFGHASWPLLDVVYPLASIAVFLLYGRVKGGLRINALTVGVFLSYLVVLALISLDDIAVVLRLSVTLTKAYWIAVEWFYPLYSIFAFFIFGRANQAEKITG
jgi:hypothetical protein